ncbi:MAG TPA: hypothetical protein VNN62_18360 [Methylomirabilota bacterium]|nr:hypothetical protein [Methylomirabilota bacterium]
MGSPMNGKDAALTSTPQVTVSMTQDRAFLEQYLSPAVLEVFPDWQGILLICNEVAASVWIVRTVQDGRRLHATTGHPALLLDEVLAQPGRNFAEMWEALRLRLIRSS